MNQICSCVYDNGYITFKLSPCFFGFDNILVNKSFSKDSAFSFPEFDAAEDPEEGTEDLAISIRVERPEIVGDL